MKKESGALLRLILLGATLAGALWLGTVAVENAAVQNLLASGGYLGIFLFSFINGFNIFVPIITASFVPALSAAGFNAFAAVAVISLGMTAADSVAFLLARAGRAHIPVAAQRFAASLARAEHWKRWLPLAILALWVFISPAPNEFILIPLGLLGYRAYPTLLIVAVGNLVFNSILGFGLIDITGIGGLGFGFL